MSEINLDNIVELLTSSYWSERAKGVQLLEDIEDFETLKSLIQKIDQKDDNTFRLVLIDYLEKLLLEKNAEKASAAFIILINYTEFSFKKLELKARSIIRNYLETPGVFRYVKLAVLMRSWRHIPDEKLLFVTKLVSEFKIFELISLVGQNFESKNKDLIVTTIDFFIRSGDKRGNRYFKKFLQESDDILVLKKSIIGLGTLGNFFDFIHVKKFLNFGDRSVRQAAIRSYIEILGVFSLPTIKKIYKETDIQVDRLFIIKTLGMFQFDSALEFLIHNYIFDSSFDEKSAIEWSIIEFSYKQKNKIFIKEYKRLDKDHRIKMLPLLSNLPTKNIRDLLLRELENASEDGFQIMLINSLGLFDHDEIVYKELRKRVQDFSTPASYYALALLFTHSKTNKKELIEESINKLTIENPHHHIVLSELAKDNRNYDESLIILNYLNESLNSQKPDIVSMTIEATHNHYNESILNSLVELMNQNVSYKSLCLKSLGYIISKNPIILKTFPTQISNDDIVSNIHKYNLENDFFLDLFQVYKAQHSSNWNYFFSKFSKYVCVNLNSILTTDDLEFFGFLLDFIEIKSKNISKPALDFIVNNIYNNAPAELQERILALFVELKNPDHFDFVLTETFKDSVITNKESEVISNFINKLS